MGEYEEMCESMGLSAGSEEDYDRLTHAMLTGERPAPRRTFRSAAPQRKELLFSTFDQASEWSKRNDGRPFTRAADGQNFTPAGGDLTRAPGQQGESVDPPSEAQLRFSALKAWRAGLARENGVPAYVIFHDATLAVIAASAPRSVAALHDIGGIGANKMKAYGDDIIRILQGVSGSYGE